MHGVLTIAEMEDKPIVNHDRGQIRRNRKYNKRYNNNIIYLNIWLTRVDSVFGI